MTLREAKTFAGQIALVGGLAGLIGGVDLGLLNLRYERGCRSWLRLAADAGDVPTARQRLGTALDYIRAHGLTRGSTATLFSTPTTDLALWYSNLNDVHRRLGAIPPDASEVDTNAALIKLREVLLNRQGGTDVVTEPPDIALYPGVGLRVVELFAACASGMVAALAAWFYIFSRDQLC